ncbi:citrate lyase beta subunit [Novosphingobium chloroacetimidivorans]|uniref:Citrate lyase beta subunit n=1 Tax=Novosphingobium chloroacetimidivorans TaxID=1428314 RepID=A0A7W7K8S3_9SPHN|nr:aldolase/citrate lyase family protein [Novosphingobium chloroacetimidivorans]MBB4858359.1 citrate lyase beta subunit [Novosphingobium chloroacetimidivorans]
MTTVPRSLLFTPGSRPDRFAKAGATAAEGLILDLEDAVAPADKDSARRHVAEFLSDRGAVRQQVTVRINPLSTVAGLLDLAMIAGLSSGPEFILLPKAESAEQVRLMSEVLAEGGSQARAGALVESARGIAQAADLARSHERLAFLMFGAADYAADLGQDVSVFRPDYARAVIVNAAAAGAIVAIDSPFFAIDRPDLLGEDCAAGRALGFHGKAAIHPAQIATINTNYSPSDDERVRARRILEAAPDGVGVLDGKMIDIAMVRWAERVL